MLFPSPELARRLERERDLIQLDYASSFDKLYPHVGTATEAVGDGHAVFVGETSPISRAVGLGIDGPVSPADLDRAEAFFFGRGMACRVDLSPFSHPSLVELVGRRGYRVAWFLNQLIRPVEAADAPPVPSPEVIVEEVPRSDLAVWAEIVSAGFGDGRRPDPTHPNIALATGHKESVRCFLARLGGEPAGGSAMEVRGTLAGFMSTSVLPAFRNRGVQTALLRRRLAEAVAVGCELVEVQTSPGSNSQRNVMRMGFQVAYTRMVMLREKP
ncbi:MAG TPA: GNAT family N-acetyltransferase [Symbiobacteriaceae bacterium]|nr:GNAT family N-acetyltransferase [Symbiobacteriaceae bacterium]